MLYRNDGIFIAGLTGMSGAGKTTACRIFSECGFETVNCDDVARRVVECGKPALVMISRRFGSDILHPDGSLDRRKLGNIVFSDARSREELNEIIYPFITYDIVNNIACGSAEGTGLVLLDAPTLFESGADALCDTIVCVTADKGACAERIMERDGITREQAEDRLSSQHRADYYIERSEFSAVNSGSLAEFEKALRVIADRICRKAREDRI